MSEIWGIPSHKIGAHTYVFSTTSQFSGNFNGLGLHLLNETLYRQSGRCTAS